MDLVQKYKSVVIITKHGKRSDYPYDLRTYAYDRGLSNIFEANIVVMEFRTEPDVYHVIKHRYQSMGEIVTRDTLNKMIAYNDKSITKDAIIAYGKAQKVIDDTLDVFIGTHRKKPYCNTFTLRDDKCPRCYGTGKL